MTMKIVEAQGYSKTKALETTDLALGLDMFKNATQAWKKAGSPLGTKAMGTFMGDYLKKHKNLAAYIVVEKSVDDTRTRPYKVINEVTAGKRKTQTFYQIKEAEFTVKVKETKAIDEETGEEVTTKVEEVTVEAVGTVIDKASKKADAVVIMKELIEATKRDYVIEIVKEVTNGQKFASYGKYTPSKAANQGKFVFCVNE